jgi:ABC-type antimicrobial peptide transport system permease subunit
MLRFDNQEQFVVTGVFEDFPANCHFAGVEMLLPMEYFFASSKEQSDMRDSWEHFSFECFVLLNPGLSPEQASAKVEHHLFDNASNDGKAVKPKGFLFPMEKWHLYADFDDAFAAPSRIRFVWMFGLIGTFVLVLACINFMNLSTARSEMRAKEVGVRKVMGSLRNQLVGQFLVESLLVVIIGFVLALVIAWSVLPAFNELSGKKITLPADRPIFYVVSISFIIITAFLSGSYPALYLSSFSPVKVLKGAFKAGRHARVPRKAMVVFQFTISLILIIGTAVVFLQLRHAKDRPVGFDREGIIQLTIRTKELAHADYNTLRADLLSSGVVENMANSDFPITGAASADASLTWEGKDPAFRPLIALNSCSHDFPATNGFQFVAGRDFSRELSSDSSAMIINEMAADLLGTDVIGKKLRFGSGREFQIVGVIKDQVRSTPFSKQSPHIYFVKYSGLQFLTVRFNRNAPLVESVKKVEGVIRKHDPNAPFEYKFQDEDYARLFHDEEQIGKLAAVFSSLAIFISCIGMFGLAAFAASQRTKEIAIRKVLGASVFSVWRMLSGEFLLLAIIAIAVSFPLAYYLANQWLQQYDYRVEVSWVMFALTALLALVITLLTVSYQALRAAWTNPANTLRSD